MKKNYLLAFSFAILLPLLFANCTKSNGDSNTYTCTCHYKDLRNNQDTVLIETYPANTSQYTAQIKCDSNDASVKVIDPTGSCKL